jgi:hypothetical protein
MSDRFHCWCDRRRLHPGFGNHDAIIGIAVVAIWLAISAPIYRRHLESVTKHGKSIGFAEHAAALGIALIVPPLLVCLVWGFGLACERISGWFSRNRK